MSNQNSFVDAWLNVAAEAHNTAKSKGFWEQGENRNISEMIMLVVTELAEAVEGLRKGNPQDDKINTYTAVEAELADAVIRIMDMSYAFGWRIPQAIEAKLEYNKSRGYKHGKEF